MRNGWVARRQERKYSWVCDTFVAYDGHIRALMAHREGRRLGGQENRGIKQCLNESSTIKSLWEAIKMIQSFFSSFSQQS